MDDPTNIRLKNETCQAKYIKHSDECRQIHQTLRNVTMAQTNVFTSSRPRLAPESRGVFSFTRLFDLWRSRQALAKLDAAGLEDIGVTSHDAQKEATKPLWDVPANWQR
jgi:uncharacterized protein YjiS (DUF1127 family)